jgi:virginiamycin B lyase
VAADGDLWFTANFANRIGRMKPNGAIVGEYPIPAANAGARCITAWPDGRLFFTAFDGGFIGEVIPE